MNRVMRRIVRRAHGDDGFAMLFTLMLMFVLFTTSIAIAGVLLSQTKPTQYLKKSIRTGDAAEAGLQAAVGELRNTTTSGVGDLTKLPCSDPIDSGGVSIIVGTPPAAVSVPGDEISGNVSTDGKAADTAAYRAVIAYYNTDPAAHEADASTTWWTTNAITCRAGVVFNPPTYAFIQSYGSGAVSGGLTGTQANRTVHAVYQFSTTNRTTVGGRMVAYTVNSGDAQLCMDAGSSPAVGTAISMQACQPLGTPAQTWQYRTDLTIFYGGDITKNLCIQKAATPTLQLCTNVPGSLNTYGYGAGQQVQEWAFNDSGHLSAVANNGSDGGGGSCLEPTGIGSSGSTPGTANAPLIVTTCAGGTVSYGAWDPDPQVGAGKAGGNVTGSPGAPTNQFVNYQLLGRCLDVSNQDVNTDALIAYPCKQAPDSSTLTWNQVWTYRAISGGYGAIYINQNNSGNYYCLTAPAVGASTNYVRVTACTPASATASQQWNLTGNVVGDYPGSYLAISKLTGQCLAADPAADPTQNHQDNSPTIVATPCGGLGVPSTTTTKQPLLLKWNAPPFNPTPGLANIEEDAGSPLTHTG